MNELQLARQIGASILRKRGHMATAKSMEEGNCDLWSEVQTALEGIRAVNAANARIAA